MRLPGTGLILAALLAAGCDAPAPPGPPRAALRLATTTSTENTGLLSALLPPFTARHGIEVHVIAVGTGKALKLGENGDVDAVLVHARDQEDRFIGNGFGVNRRDVMVNDFILAGPPDDPAKVRGLKDAARALGAILRSGRPFVSRGDRSGTHAKEMELWAAAGLTPSGDGYLEAGQGMGPVLQMAHEKRAYTLTDRGTFLAYKGKIDLAPLVEGDPRLRNPYGIMAVNPARHPHVRYAEAMALIAWVTSPEGQGIIAGFKAGGEPLFHPLAVPGK